MALIATVSALVLGLLIASTKSSAHTQRSEFIQMSANAILLDRTLARYGSETEEARDMLRRATISLDQNWSQDTSRCERLDSSATRAAGASFYEMIQELAPLNDFQRSFQSQAVQIAFELGRTRSLLLEQVGSSIPTPFSVMLVFWLVIIFTRFGLFAPGKASLVATVRLGGFSFGGDLRTTADLRHSAARRYRASRTVTAAAKGCDYAVTRPQSSPISADEISKFARRQR